MKKPVEAVFWTRHALSSPNRIGRWNCLFASGYYRGTETEKETCNEPNQHYSSLPLCFSGVGGFRCMWIQIKNITDFILPRVIKISRENKFSFSWDLRKVSCWINCVGVVWSYTRYLWVSGWTQNDGALYNKRAQRVCERCISCLGIRVRETLPCQI